MRRRGAQLTEHRDDLAAVIGAVIGQVLQRLPERLGGGLAGHVAIFGDALEIGGALLLVAGLWTRIAALALAAFTVLAALLFHANFADATQQIMFLKNLAIAGRFLVLAAIVQFFSAIYLSTLIFAGSGLAGAFRRHRRVAATLSGAGGALFMAVSVKLATASA